MVKITQSIQQKSVWNFMAPLIRRIVSRFFPCILKIICAHITISATSTTRIQLQPPPSCVLLPSQWIYSSFSFLTSLIALSKSFPLSAASNLIEHEWRLVKCWKKQNGRWDKPGKAPTQFSTVKQNEYFETSIHHRRYPIIKLTRLLSDE